jgi:hypothetical protein
MPTTISASAVPRRPRIAVLALAEDPLSSPESDAVNGSSFCYDLVRLLVRSGEEVDVVTRLSEDSSQPSFEQIGFHLRVHRVAVGERCGLRVADVAPLLVELLEGAGPTGGGPAAVDLIVVADTRTKFGGDSGP